MLAPVIDDSRVMRMILKRILLGLGFDVVEAAHEYVIKPFTAEAIVDKPSLLGLVPRTSATA